MKWRMIREVFDGKEEYGKRPHVNHKFDCESEVDKNYRIPCLVRYNKEKLKENYGENALLVENYVDKLYYDPNNDSWFDLGGNYRYNFECNEIESYIPLKELDSTLSGIPEPELCWSYGYTLAKTSVPALNKWIEKGYGYPDSIGEDKWNEIIGKIKHAFEVSIEDFENELGITTQMSEDEKQKIIKDHKSVLESHKRIRKEAFELMAEYYLDLWD